MYIYDDKVSMSRFNEFSVTGAAVKPFGSFVSDLYSKSGDLDLSVEFGNGSNLLINKKKKQNVLREVRRALRGNLCYIASNIDKHVCYIAHQASMK